MLRLTVYTRRGCHLCEELLEALLPLVRDRAVVEALDIDEDETLRLRYDTAVPVVAMDDVEICRYRLDRAAVLSALDKH